MASYTSRSSGVSQPDMPQTLLVTWPARMPKFSIRRTRSRILEKAAALPTDLKLVAPPESERSSFPSPSVTISSVLVPPPSTLR